MQSPLPAPLRLLSRNQWFFVVTIFIVVIFLVIGSLNQPGGNETPSLLGSQPFIVLAVLAFGAGLLSFVSPCTLPVLTAYFAFAFQSGRSQIAANTMAFMLGLATTFSLLGAAAFALGSVLYQNQGLILLIGGSLIMVFGVMSLLGRGFGGVQTGDGQPSATVGGSYLFGLTFAVGWSSCVGPILGAVLTLAAQTTAVTQGIALLFIYALGLGLPLLIVSTFFGRVSRQSLFWRILRGKGWQVTAHTFAVALVWAVMVFWPISMAVIRYVAVDIGLMPALVLNTAQQIGLLILAVAGAAIWTLTTSAERRMTIQLHSTQLISGALFLLIGWGMLSGRLAAFNDLIPPQLSEWLAIQEDRLIQLFN